MAEPAIQFHRPGLSRGPWYTTYTGRRFFPLDPRAPEVDMADIAHSLSLICRFAGHCNQFFSVAQHSVFVSHLVDPEHAMWGLMHDAAEAYIGDIRRPLKGLVPNVKDIEGRILVAIAMALGLPVQIPPAVKVADNVALATEAALLMANTDGWDMPEGPVNVPLVPVGPREARESFLTRFAELKAI